MLTRDQAGFIAAAIAQWSGPLQPNEPLLAYLEISDRDEFYDIIDRLEESISVSGTLNGADLRFAVKIAELTFASTFNGAGPEWETVTGYPDEVALTVLRSIQRII
ncbi:hypothetical protein GCM10025864_25540 [Luteimicrobium album]|uniref:Uncharacterized protein n=1 Tax=Luteimicrobium album TaxID=1054550 RepID=A0ABQ6I4T5_9MICO|nr:hypothetical protein [Luteimicrobium album]GMA24795.1 hypothetical protein GCM10025864_25540 [Luteimicrobium album]